MAAIKPRMNFSLTERRAGLHGRIRRFFWPRESFASNFSRKVGAAANNAPGDQIVEEVILIIVVTHSCSPSWFGQHIATYGDEGESL